MSEERYKYKQAIILRTDLKMRRGKEIAQGAHASMKALLDYPDHEYMNGWLNDRFAKIALGVHGQEEFMAIYEVAKEKGWPCALIQDAGFTEFGGVPTYTAIAVGPAPVAMVDELVGYLKLR
jgi:PTH2 family peptidyl-tRNA hydrolase